MHSFFFFKNKPIMQCHKAGLSRKKKKVLDKQERFHSEKSFSKQSHPEELEFYGPYQYFTAVTTLTQMPRWFMLPNGSFILQHMLCVLFSRDTSVRMFFFSLSPHFCLFRLFVILVPLKIQTHTSAPRVFYDL